MGAVPRVSGQTCVRALERLGYRVARRKGSHIRMTCPGRNPTTVPDHREVLEGTLRGILRDVGITVDEFRALLG